MTMFLMIIVLTNKIHKCVDSFCDSCSIHPSASCMYVMYPVALFVLFGIEKP